MSRSYRKTAERLRNELRNRKSANPLNEPVEKSTDETRPPGLRGREIGLWYANRNKIKRQLESEQQNRMLSGPNISLPENLVNQMRKDISDVQEDIAANANSQMFHSDFSRYKNTDFTESITIDERLIRSPGQPTDLDKRLFNEFKMTFNTEAYKRMFQFRQTLPSYQIKDKIVCSVQRHQVLLIAGNTGCGKTTQVAQYILDHAITSLQGSKTKILCTQPRRIAAVSIAERVATERGQELGHSIGYQIRLEKVPPRSAASILFCTTGVLLKFMAQSPNLSHYSHIIIDEIHERNAITDVCLALIKTIIKHRRSLKVILMSATLNEKRFAEYFDNCPILRIEGSAHSVRELFLEDILEETGFNNFNQSKTEEPMWLKYRNKHQDASQSFDSMIKPYANSIRGRYSPKTIEQLKCPDTEKINLTFIQHLIRHICNTKPSGAILVFLPGFTTISRLYDNLQRNFPPELFHIYPLHSLLTGSDQREIFKRPPDGVRKIIISTPLAETSITIDDVVYVINAGKMRRPYFDFDKGVKIFEDEWITRANEVQRMGRAGRTCPGVCYHLYSRGRSNSFEPFEKPEILRVRLEEHILMLKVLCVRNVKEFAYTMIDIPDESVIDSSISCLQRLGALTDQEELTPLGLLLSNLGVHPKIGKMLLLGSVFSCFGPISSSSAGLSFRSPFYVVMGKEKLCDEAKRKFSVDSDQLAAANAVKEWKTRWTRSRNIKDYCSTNFLSHSTMLMLDRMRSQFVELLHNTRFLSNTQCDSRENNRNSKNVDLLKAVITGGAYPNIAYRSVKVNKGKRSDRIMTMERKSLKLLTSSVNNDPRAHYDSGFIVFDEMHRYTHDIFITETTSNVSPYGILLFGDKINVGVNNISVGDIIEFRCNRDTADLIVTLRDEFNKLLNNKILASTSTFWDTVDNEQQESSPIVWKDSEAKLLQIVLDVFSIRNSNDDVESDDDDDSSDGGDETTMVHFTEDSEDF